MSNLHISSKVCLFWQKSGIGDVCFLQKVAHHYRDLGYKIIWPLLPQLMFLNDYLISPANFIETQGLVTLDDDVLFLDFQNADKYFEGSVLEAKYKYVGLDYKDWTNYFEFKRNKEKEEELFQFLNLEGKKYTLINKKYGTPPNFKEKEVYVEGDNMVVEIQFLDNYCPFDWCKVIEEADQISIVDTSYNYLIEKLNLKATKMFLTSRFTPANFTDINNLFTNRWIKIQ